MTGYKAEDESISDYIQFLVKTHAILKYYSIMVVIFGSGFNLINFACFYQMKKRSSQNIYLIFLSLADLFNIQINITIPLIRNALSKKNLVDFDFFINESESGGTNLTSTPSDPNPWAEFFCILDGYLVEVGLLLPAWIMVVLAAERFLIIAWPLRKNIICTLRHAKIILTTLVVIVMTFSCYKFWTAGIENDSIFRMWPLRASCRRIVYPNLVNASITLQMIIPPILCLILNILIIKIIKTSPHAQFYPTERSKKINQTTYTVISLSIIFVILISPTGVLTILDQLYNNSYKEYKSEKDSDSDVNIGSVKNVLGYMIARKYALMLYETNMVINFPIYILTIRNFRETLKRNLLPNVLLKLIIKRRNSTEIGMRLKQLTFKSPDRKMKMQVNLEAKRVWNFNRFRLGEHYQLAHSINVHEDLQSDISTEKHKQAFRQACIKSISNKQNNSYSDPKAFNGNGMAFNSFSEYKNNNSRSKSSNEKS